MANENEQPQRDDVWVDKKLSTLQVPADRPLDLEGARRRLAARGIGERIRWRYTVALVATALVTLVVLPWPRALAQELWARFTADRVEILESNTRDVSEELAATFAMTPEDYSLQPVGDLQEATRLTGLVAKLPDPGVLSATPELSVIRSVKLTTRPLDVGTIRQALTSAGIDHVDVPDDWQGTTLVAEGGPAIVADYGDIGIVQLRPLEMQAPARVQFGRFMELAFLVFGRDSGEARRLGEKFQANPALVLHFPERAPVVDVPLGDGRSGLIVGALDGSDGNVCFFFNTADRIFIVDADSLTEEQAVAIATSIR